MKFLIQEIKWSDIRKLVALSSHVLSSYGKFQKIFLIELHRINLPYRYQTK